MSEAKRYYVNLDHGTLCTPRPGCDSAVVKASDLDRVTAERDAALGREAVLNRLISNQAETIKQLSGRYGPIAEALHQRLTAADERADVLETALAGMLFAFDDGVGLDWSEELLDFARKLTAAKEFKSALKPAEGGGDEG